jgi:type I restriction-modification system DNA methylase subunit
MTKEDILKKCTIEGNIVKLPVGQLDRKLYQEVSRSLNLIGGKWTSGKTLGFVFQSDPTDLLSQIANGDKRNIKKEYQFFETPENLADKIVELANIEEDSTILEPSSGHGSIINAILRKHPHNFIFYCEKMITNQMILNNKYGDCENVYFLHPLNDDFLEMENTTFDRIVANPPFRNNQDCLHIQHMYNCLKVGGRLVSVASTHWKLSNNNTEKNFREWLLKVGAEEITVEAGTFKESGTMIESTILIIDKV